MKLKLVKLSMVLAILSGVFSCGEFLDEKPSKQIVVPSSIEDLQSILNAVDNINSGDSYGILLSDDIYTTDEGWLGYSEHVREGYIWNMQMSNAQGDVASWSSAYSSIFRFNIVLEESGKIIPEDETERRQLEIIKASALFLRSFNYFELLQMFTHPVLSDADLEREGIPLKLTPDFDDLKGKSTIGEVYGQIIADLNEAAELLPATSEDLLRPSKAACLGLLSQIYLQLGDYEKALEHAEQVLEIKSSLLDYNSIPALEDIPIPLYNYPIPRFNEEVIIHLLTGSQSYMGSFNTFTNREVYGSYEENDIRRYLYFTEPDEAGRVNYLGSYNGNFRIFAGITTAELYLISAESLARLGRDSQAVDRLNALLEARYFEGTFEPLALEAGESVLERVLVERRKELIFRGMRRWADMRRFLRDPDWGGVAPRTIEGVEYKLGLSPENYMLEIPLNEQQRNDAL